jgi:hypothetical protein
MTPNSEFSTGFPQGLHSLPSRIETLKAESNILIWRRVRAMGSMTILMLAAE